MSDYHDALIPLDISNPREPLVNAWDLHTFLESKQEFTHWFNLRRKDCDLVEDEDFGVLEKIIKNPSGGRPSKEYWLTLDASKEISMMERNEKGKQARRYFIACEKRLRNMPTVPTLDFSDPLTAAKLYIEAEEGRRIAVAEVKELTEEVATQSVEKEVLQQQFNLIAAKVDVAGQAGVVCGNAYGS